MNLIRLNEIKQIDDIPDRICIASGIIMIFEGSILISIGIIHGLLSVSRYLIRYFIKWTDEINLDKLLSESDHKKKVISR